MTAARNGNGEGLTPILLEGSEIKTWKPVPAKYNHEGEELEPPAMDIVFRVPLDTVGTFMTRLAWMFRNRVGVTLVVEGVEQTAFGFSAKPRVTTKRVSKGDAQAATTAGRTE